MQVLKKQDVENQDVLDLITDMSDIVDYTSTADQFVTLAQLEAAIEEMEKLIEQAVGLIIKRKKRSNTGMLSCSNLRTRRTNAGSEEEIWVMVFSEDRETIDNLKLQFARFKQKFDRGISVQTALTVVKMREMLRRLGASKSVSRSRSSSNSRALQSQHRRTIST